MKAASIDDIKQELKGLPPKKLLDLTLRLARFKKENKELLTFLLFEAGNPAGYVESLQHEIDEEFSQIEKGPTAPIKKKLRKILRMINRQVKYIGSKTANVELLIHFCTNLQEHEASLISKPGIETLYLQQLTKIRKLLPLIDQDLQYDIEQKLNNLKGDLDDSNAGSRKWWRLKRTS